MYEEIAPRRNGAFRAVFLVIVLGFVLLSLPDWVAPYNTPFDLPYAVAVYELLLFVGMAVCVLRLVRRYSAEYKYTLVDATLTVKEKLGARETVVEQITVSGNSQLVPLAQAGEILEQCQIRPSKITYGVSDKNAAYVITFPPKNGKTALIFQPSAKFVEILQQIALDKRREM